MPATAGILFCLFILKKIELRVAGLHGGREGEATQGLQQVIKILESILTTSKTTLDSTNIPLE